MRDHRPAKTPLPDPMQDLLSAETFAAALPAHYLDTIGTSAPVPSWLTIEAENQRYLAAQNLHQSAQSQRQNPAAEKALILARRIRQCAESLAILADRETDALLPLAMRCGSRWCPPCAVSKCYSRAFAIIRSHGPLARDRMLLHAVYTMRNCNLSELRAAAKALRKALRYALGQEGGHGQPLPGFEPIRGSILNLEVTYSEDRDDWHPHLHVLHVSPRLDQRLLSWDWSRAMVHAGLPAIETLVYLAPLRANRKRGLAAAPAGATNDLASAAFEVAKYACKPPSYQGPGAPRQRDLVDLAAALRYLRVSEATGESRTLLAADRAPPEANYSWCGSLRQYLHDSDPKDQQQAMHAIAASSTARRIHTRYYH